MNDEASKRLERIEKEMSIVRNILIRLDKTMVINTRSLDEHMRRTKLLETELKPITKHVEQMRGAAKLIGLLALIASIVMVVK